MMTTRRGFLAWSGALAAAARVSAKPLGLPIGLQPYTVRNEMTKDLAGTLKQLAAMGYEAIEAGVPFYGKQAAEARDLLKSCGLTSPSGGFAAKEDGDWARAADSAKVLGVEYMIATVPREWTKSLDGWKRGADLLNRRGEISKKAGLALAYHNHHFEFTRFDGVPAYDRLLQSTDPALVKMEMDLFWVTYAGQDPLAWFDKYPGRFPLWHIKDLKPGQTPSTDAVPGNPFAEVGSGIIDWKRIFSGAKKAGLRYYFIEQDRWDRPPLESARMSCDFMKKFRV